MSSTAPTFNAAQSASSASSPRSLGNASHRVRFGSVVSSEWSKIMTNRPVLFTSLGYLIFSWLFIALTSWSTSQLGSDVTGGSREAAADIALSLLIPQTAVMIVVLISASILVVTTEYGANTMRVTTLSVPNRTVGFLAKVTAGAAFALVVATIALVGSVLIESLVGNLPFVLTDGRWWGYASNILSQVLAAIGGIGLGYLVRSSAGAIVIEAVVMMLSSALGLIQLGWFHDYVMPIIPPNALNGALVALNDHEFLPISEGLLEPLPSFGVWAAWTLLAALFGWLRYRRSDV